MDWVDKPQNYKDLYGILQLLQGSNLNNFPLKTLKLDWVAFHSVAFQFKCLDFQSNQDKKLAQSSHVSAIGYERGRSSSLAFLSNRNTFAYWTILLCREISPFAEVNILTALLPVPHTKTKLRYTHKAVGLFHRLWTLSRWPAVSPHTFVRVCAPPSISSSVKVNCACSLLEDKDTVPPSVTAIPMRTGIFEIVLSFNCPLT